MKYSNPNYQRGLITRIEPFKYAGHRIIDPISGTRFNALNGAGIVNTEKGRCLSFTSTNHYYTSTGFGDYRYEYAYTIFSYLYFRGVSSNTGIIWQKNFTPSIRINTSYELNFRGQVGGVNQNLTSTLTTFTTGTWTSAAIRYKGKQSVDCFRDGLYLDSLAASSFTTELTRNSVVDSIGGLSINNYSIDADILCIYRWNRALSDAEIKYLHNNPKCIADIDTIPIRDPRVSLRVHNTAQNQSYDMEVNPDDLRIRRLNAVTYPLIQPETR